MLNRATTTHVAPLEHTSSVSRDGRTHKPYCLALTQHHAITYISILNAHLHDRFHMGSDKTQLELFLLRQQLRIIVHGCEHRELPQLLPPALLPGLLVRLVLTTVFHSTLDAVLGLVIEH